MIIPIISIFVVVVDQISKVVVSGFFLKNPPSVPVVQDIFHFTYVENTGVAFGLFRDHPEILLGVIVVSIVVLLFYLIRLKEKQRHLLTAYGFIIGGAFGNLIDRVRLGFVIDFLDFRVWPVFNLADSFITMGVALVVIDLLFCQKKQKAS